MTNYLIYSSDFINNCQTSCLINLTLRNKTTQLKKNYSEYQTSV